MRYIASIIILIIGISLIATSAYFEHHGGYELGIGIALFMGIPISILGILQIVRCIKADNQNLTKIKYFQK